MHLGAALLFNQKLVEERANLFANGITPLWDAARDVEKQRHQAADLHHIFWRETDGFP